MAGDAADTAGVDPCTAVEAAKGETYRPVLEADREAGVNTGMEGTPAVIVNGELLSGASTFENVASLIDEQL